VDHETEALAFIARTTGWDDDSVGLALAVLRDEGINDYYLDSETGSPIDDLRAKARARLAEMPYLRGMSGEDPGAIWADIQDSSVVLMKAKAQAYATYKSGHGSPEDDAEAIATAAQVLADLWRRMAAAQGEPWQKVSAHHRASHVHTEARVARQGKTG